MHRCKENTTERYFVETEREVLIETISVVVAIFVAVTVILYVNERFCTKMLNKFQTMGNRENVVCEVSYNEGRYTNKECFLYEKKTYQNTAMVKALCLLCTA